MGLPSDPSVETIHGGGANTNIVYHAGKLMALQEGSNPYLMDKATLDSKAGSKPAAASLRIRRWIPRPVRWCGSPIPGEGPLNPYLDYGVTNATGEVRAATASRRPIVRWSTTSS